MITGLTIRRVIEDVDSVDVIQYRQARDKSGFIKDMVREKYGFASPYRVQLATTALSMASGL